MQTNPQLFQQAFAGMVFEVTSLKLNRWRIIAPGYCPVLLCEDWWSWCLCLVKTQDSPDTLWTEILFAPSCYNKEKLEQLSIFVTGPMHENAILSWTALVGDTPSKSTLPGYLVTFWSFGVSGFLVLVLRPSTISGFLHLEPVAAELFQAIHDVSQLATVLCAEKVESAIGDYVYDM